MTEEETQQLTTGITGGTGDRNPYCHMHDYATSRTIMLIGSIDGTRIAQSAFRSWDTTSLPSRLDFRDEKLAQIDKYAVESGVDLWTDARQATG